mmetsp:Transcript_15108/g.29224  ORF Transcript_15108/g.29224 Transcript_15108/m.29224 type:complete len:221 (+) Transcript_15108:101-763(+)
MSMIGQSKHAENPATTFLLELLYRLTVPSSLPAATTCPFGLKATQLTGESRTSSLAMDRYPILENVLEFHRERLPWRASPLSAEEATTANSVSDGLHFTLIISVNSLCTTTSKTKRFESTFQPFTVPSAVPKSTSFSLRGSQSKQSTLHAVLIVTFLLLGVASSSALQILIVPSLEELATFSPSGEYLQHVIGASWPSKSETRAASSPAARDCLDSAAIC